MNRWLLFSLLIFFVPLPQAYGQSHYDEDSPSLGDDYEYSSNVFVSTVEASSTTIGDATGQATGDSTQAVSDESFKTSTEATSGEDGNRSANAGAAIHFAKVYRRQIERQIAEGGGEKAFVVAVLLAGREHARSFIELSQAHFLEIYPEKPAAFEEEFAVLARLAQRYAAAPVNQ